LQDLEQQPEMTITPIAEATPLAGVKSLISLNLEGTPVAGASRPDPVGG
jgi:hypothetical protein